MSAPVRVRYAPSPTGEPHVGNIRTALFNWLYARHTDGAFIVRIEDTDRARTVPGALEAILESLRWLGLDWDEGPEVGGPYGPYLQSQRTEAGIYKEAADRLIASGRAYQCYCPPERLEEVRMRLMREKKPPMYDRWCRDPQRGAQMAAEHRGAAPVVRLKVPYEEDLQITFFDVVHGEVTMEAATLDDLVLLKSDGYPTYHLANVVDDHLMEISHVIRGDEWMPMEGMRELSLTTSMRSPSPLGPQPAQDWPSRADVLEGRARVQVEVISIRSTPMVAVSLALLTPKGITLLHRGRLGRTANCGSAAHADAWATSSCCGSRLAGI